MAADAGKHFSMARVLHPWPAERFHILVDMMSQLQEPLASVFLQAALRKESGLALSAAQISNVIWKVRTYFPSMLALRYPPGNLSARLKEIQELAPAEPTVRLPPREGPCPRCQGPLIARASMVASSHARNLPSANKAPGPIRFKFYSLAAGVQYASFTEAVCGACRRIYLGAWSYQRKATAGAACYGRM